MEMSCNGVISCNVHTPFATSNSLDTNSLNIWLVYTSVFNSYLYFGSFNFLVHMFVWFMNNINKLSIFKIR